MGRLFSPAVRYDDSHLARERGMKPSRKSCTKSKKRGRSHVARGGSAREAKLVSTIKTVHEIDLERLRADVVTLRTAAETLTHDFKEVGVNGDPSVYGKVRGDVIAIADELQRRADEIQEKLEIYRRRRRKVTRQKHTRGRYTGRRGRRKKRKKQDRWAGMRRTISGGLPGLGKRRL
jgi:hypothetical protein